VNKQLTHDIVYQEKLTAAFIENNPIGCYDWKMNNLLLLELQCLGLSPSTATALSSIWMQAIHHIRTKYGISSAS
jgi:hypothetical protein